MFITDLIRNLYNISTSIEENDTKEYLNLIEKHLGLAQRTSINKYFSATLQNEDYSYPGSEHSMDDHDNLNTHND